MNKKNKQLIAASLFLSGETGVNIFDLKKITNQTINSTNINEIIAEINSNWSNNELCPFQIKKYGLIYKMITIPSLFEELNKVIKVNFTAALTPVLTEVLAIIAYSHPICTRKIIENIRQTDPNNAINRLLELKLIQINNPNDPINQAQEYKLSAKAFDLFGIKSINELPKLSQHYQKYFQLSLEEQQISREINDFFDNEAE